MPQSIYHLYEIKTANFFWETTLGNKRVKIASLYKLKNHVGNWELGAV
jgi:hypothetical protein